MLVSAPDSHAKHERESGTTGSKYHVVAVDFISLKPRQIHTD